MKEVWRFIPEYRDLYQASNKGRIRVMRPILTLKPQLHQTYMYVGLWKRGTRKLKLVHRLVISAFRGNSVLEVNHIDGDKLNNSLRNLEYCTRSEIEKHAHRLGLKKSPNIKLTEGKVKLIRKLYKTGEYTQKFLARKFDISQQTISIITLNQIWINI